MSETGGETKTMNAAVILWAAGVAASPLGKKLGAPIDRAGRVLVNPDLSLPNHPEVFVIGDLAALKDKSGKLLPGVAPVAILEGRFVAKLIRKEIATGSSGVSSRHFTISTKAASPPSAVPPPSPSSARFTSPDSSPGWRGCSSTFSF